MKKIIFLFISTISLFAQMYDLKPIEITKNIDCFIGDFNPPMKSNKGFVSNVCTVNTGDEIVVIEAGPTYNFAKELNEFIKNKHNKKVSYVIVTNFHDDRYTGASYYKQKNIPIIAHESIVKELDENIEKFNRIPKVTTDEEYKNSKIVQADILIKNKYLIEGKKINIEVLKLSTASNSISDIAVFVPNEEFIFTGNIVFNGRMIKYAKFSNMHKWIEALENLEKMNVKYVMGGHGKEFDRDSFRPTLNYLRILKTNVTKAYEEDVDLEDIANYVNDKEFSYLNHFNQISPSNAKTYYEHLEWAE